MMEDDKNKQEQSAEQNNNAPELEQQPHSTDSSSTEQTSAEQGETQQATLNPNSDEQNSVTCGATAGQVGNPFSAIQAIILKPNSVFATLKNTHNWSWIAFAFVTLFSILPTWLYFDQIDMVWYSEKVIELQMPDVSPSEKEQAKQLMQTQPMGSLTAFFIAITAIIVNAIFAFYLHKMTQMDEDNILSFGDWYGFTWWATLPFAFIGILSSLIVLLWGDPQMSPEYLSVFSLAFVLGIPMESGWFGWAQGIGLDSFWIMYLTAVGISQWTKLNRKQCTIIAVAPFIIVWGVWAAFLII